MPKDTSKLEEKLVSNQGQTNEPGPNSAHATPVVEKYIEERKDKADKQTDDEANGITYAKQTKSDWDEWVSYRYAIL